LLAQFAVWAFEFVPPGYRRFLRGDGRYLPMSRSSFFLVPAGMTLGFVMMALAKAW
jgi:hypothetical protein